MIAFRYTTVLVLIAQLLCLPMSALASCFCSDVAASQGCCCVTFESTGDGCGCGIPGDEDSCCQLNEDGETTCECSPTAPENEPLPTETRDSETTASSISVHAVGWTLPNNDPRLASAHCVDRCSISSHNQRQATLGVWLN